MRIIRSAPALAAAALLLAGCGEQASSSAPLADAAASTATSASDDTGDSPSPDWTGDVIPDGTYTQTRTTADAKRLGIPTGKSAEIFGGDGEFHVELRTAGDVWAQYGDDGGSMALGDEGTATYDAAGNWVVASNSSSCAGCTATFAWSLKDGQLTLEMVDTTEAGNPVDLLVARLVMEGTWTRQ